MSSSSDEFVVEAEPGTSKRKKFTNKSGAKKEKKEFEAFDFDLSAATNSNNFVNCNIDLHIDMLPHGFSVLAKGQGRKSLCVCEEEISYDKLGKILYDIIRLEIDSKIFFGDKKFTLSKYDAALDDSLKISLFADIKYDFFLNMLSKMFMSYKGTELIWQGNKFQEFITNYGRGENNPLYLAKPSQLGSTSLMFTTAKKVEKFEVTSAAFFENAIKDLEKMCKLEQNNLKIFVNIGKKKNLVMINRDQACPLQVSLVGWQQIAKEKGGDFILKGFENLCIV